MRAPFNSRIEQARLRHATGHLPPTSPGDTFGVFVFTRSGQAMTVMVGDGNGWDHVSVSFQTRTPTWAEMAWVKRQFFRRDEVVMQLHVADADHIDFHRNCLHLWRPQDQEIPLPPKVMV